MKRLKQVMGWSTRCSLFFGLAMCANAANTNPDLSPAAYARSQANQTVQLADSRASVPANPDVAYGLLAGLVIMASIAMRRKTKA